MSGLRGYSIGESGRGARAASGLVIGAAVVAASIGSVLAAAGPAAAGGAAPSCTVTWVGRATEPVWTDSQNWSTGKLPGPADDVCITNTGDDVLTAISIDVHSLLLGSDAGIAMVGTSSDPVTATVAKSVTMTPGGVSRIELTDASINAARIEDRGGTIFTNGPCKLASPDVIFAAGGGLQAAFGTTTLTHLPQLDNGTLTGASLGAAFATVVLPGDVTGLVGSSIAVGEDSAIQDRAGRDALAGLTLVDAQSSLSDATNLMLTGSSFTARGNVTFDGGTVTIRGPLTQAQGTLTLDPDTVLRASPATVGNGALLTDDGTITELVNNGTTQVGAGTAQITGNYTQAPGARLISGFTRLLAVTGKATLAGSVSVSKLFTVSGATTTVITFGSLSGGFAGHNLGLRLITRTSRIDAIVVPRIAVQATAVAPGQKVTVDGGGFTYPHTVRIFLDTVGGPPLATTFARARGTFKVTVTIPESSAAGRHRLTAVASDGHRASAAITVS